MLLLPFAACLVAAPVSEPIATQHPCAACAAVANELERQMREEWAHLQLTVRDRKRLLAQDAVKEQACGEAIQQILHGICDATRDYAVGKDARGGVYFQPVRNLERGESIVVTGTLHVGGPTQRAGLDGYCETLLRTHEDGLAALMADGTDDLITDLCINAAHECTPEAAEALPVQGRPRSR